MLKFSPKIRLGMLINVMLIKKNMYCTKPIGNGLTKLFNQTLIY